MPQANLYIRRVMERTAFLPRKHVFSLPVPGWLFLIPVLFGIAIVSFCVCYLAHTYNWLQDLYLRLNPCIYWLSSWKEGFFNDVTKNAGNKHAVTGIACALAIMMSSIYKWRKHHKWYIHVSFSNKDVVIMSALIIWTSVLWIWGFYSSAPAYDEVFSAVNCADVPVVHTISYYMLPNNHVLFNTLNNLAFYSVYDKVLTGRIISGLSQILLTILLYWWLYKKTGHRGYATLYCALLLMQFPVWGFSFQARGYAIYLLCCWLSAISLEAYFRRRTSVALYLHAISIVIGFAIMPPFLFWYLALLLSILIRIIFKRKFDVRIMVAHAFAGIAVYLFYLPTIAYSGLRALTDNRYVAIIHSTLKEFWDNFSYGFGASVQYCFGADVDGHNKLYYILFALPLLLLPFLRKKPSFVPAAFYVIVWLAFAILQLKFRHYPFMRNMIAHDSITFAAILLSIHFAVQAMAQRFRIKLMLPIVASLFCIAAGIHFVRFMRDHVNDSLYYYSAKSQYDAITSTLRHIPQGAGVWCSDQSFYPQYVLRRRGVDASHCSSESQQYFITDRNEGIPPVVDSGLIRPVDSVLQYLIYRKALP